MKLYVYEHCPYCVLVRLAFAVKGIPYTIEYLFDDDIKAHTDKVGAKQVPILQKDDGTYMKESMDIVKYVDALWKPVIFAPYTMAEALAPYFDPENLKPVRYLAFLATKNIYFPEISKSSARKYHVKRFLKKMPYDHVESIESDREMLTAKVYAFMDSITPYIYSDKHMGKQGVGIDDVLGFSKLFALSIIPDLKIPSKLEKYIEAMLSFAKIRHPQSWKMSS